MAFFANNYLQFLIGQQSAAQLAWGVPDGLSHVHEHLKLQAAKAVNINLTLRNWIFGWRIKEYELKGRDRAKYGEGLFTVLSKKLSGCGIPNCSKWQLYRYCNFYLAFPEILSTLYSKLGPMPYGNYHLSEIFGTVSRKSQSKRPQAAKVGTLYPHAAERRDRCIHVIKRPVDSNRAKLKGSNSTRFKPIEFDGFKKRVSSNSQTW